MSEPHRYNKFKIYQHFTKYLIYSKTANKYAAQLVEKISLSSISTNDLNTVEKFASILIAKQNDPSSLIAKYSELIRNEQIQRLMREQIGRAEQMNKLMLNLNESVGLFSKKVDNLADQSNKTSWG